jgi:uncharacterized protein (TIGR02284 family)
MGGRMIRDERMAALDKAALSLHAAGHMYGHFAEDLRGEPMAGRFEELASARREQAEELEGLIRELGGLPGEPDPDKLSFTDFLDKVRSALAEDDKTPLLQRARDEERRLRDDLSEVLAHDLPSEAASRLKGMVDSSLETERWLLEELG